MHSSFKKLISNEKNKIETQEEKKRKLFFITKIKSNIIKNKCV